MSGEKVNGLLTLHHPAQNLEDPIYLKKNRNYMACHIVEVRI